MIIKGMLYENIKLDIEIHDNLDKDGGVYVFYIEKTNVDICGKSKKCILYVGESGFFLKRITEHIVKLKKSKSYFGLGKLEENYTITLKIHCGGYPYNPDNKDQYSDERKKKEVAFLNINKSLTQYDPNSKKKCDTMINNKAPACKLDKSMLKELEPDNYKKWQNN